VISFELIANKRPIITACRGDAKRDASLAALALPCSKRPAGKTIINGHVGQSRITAPGAAPDWLAIRFTGGGDR
jgi:hypothetical protein